jgi:hypothetical protein
MEQKDIDRLLICRAAVDKQRAFNAARVEAYTTCKSVTEAKALIETKTGVATTISAASAVKTADAIKSTLEAERTKMTLEINDILLSQGFDSASEFKEWQDKLCLEEFKKCYPIEGFCDGCKGLPEPCCIKFFPEPCVSADKPEVTFNIYAMSMEAVRDHTYLDHGTIWKWAEGCPKDHGFFIDTAKITIPPVDLFWGL